MRIRGNGKLLVFLVVLTRDCDLWLKDRHREVFGTGETVRSRVVVVVSDETGFFDTI